MRSEADRTRPSDRPRRVGGAFALALLAALLLASGTGRLFVVCLGPNGTERPHVAFVHPGGVAPSTCATHAGAGHGAGSGAREAVAPGSGTAHEGHCVDLRLPGFEGAPDDAPAPPQPPAAAPAVLAFARPPAAACPERAHAPATGPPRADERARLRRVIVLQV